jgi:S-adenosyl methyltransferase
VAASQDVPPGVEPTRPTPARLYDYFLGGTNNFEADRLLGERLKVFVPEVSGSALANRAFHQRAARWLAGQGLRQFIDPGQATGLLMTGVMYFVADESDPWGLVAAYVGAMAPGSYLALSHLTGDGRPERAAAEGRDVYARGAEDIHFRSRAQVERFFAGLELVPPYAGGRAEVTHVGLWGTEDQGLADTDDARWLYCGVARRP